MTREEAYKTLKENLCAMCAYGSQNMESCDIRSCDNRDAIKALEQEPQTFKWCTDCREYDQEKHCCHRWSKVIRNTVEEMKQGRCDKCEVGNPCLYCKHGFEPQESEETDG